MSRSKDQPLPDMKYLKVQDIIDAINGDEESKQDVFAALRGSGAERNFPSGEIVIRTPGKLLITPVRVDYTWTSFEKPDQPAY